MGIIANTCAIALTALILPGFDIADRRLTFLILVAVVLGLLNTFIKPILQILTIRLLFLTYGLILILINTIVLWLLSLIFANLHFNGWLPMILGAIFIGLFGAFFDYLLGVMPPIGYQQAVEEQEAIA